MDESGLSQRPHRVRTWSKRGVTPVLQHQFNWDNLSIAAGITSWQFYFRLYEGTMGKEEVLDFVSRLIKQIDQPILLIWDRLPGHRSRLVQDYLASLQGKIAAFYLPAYAPELNRRRSRGVTHLCLDRVTRIGNRVWNVDQRGMREQYHPRRRRVSFPSAQRCMSVAQKKV